MRKTIKITIALLCTFATLLSTSVFAYGGNAETTASNNYIEFGSYPQTEVVSQASDSGVYGKSWEAQSDYIIDASLYDSLKNLSDDNWNTHDDATVGGNKYHRIKANNATLSKSYEANYYNWVSTDTYHYFKYEPIKWEILEQDNNDTFLLSEIVLDDQMYNTNITGSLTWETSTIRSWLNGYDSTKNSYGTDYSNSNFIDTAFTSEEQSKIKSTTVENKDNSKSGTEGGNDTSDKVYLLSEDEVYGSNATKYGFASDYDTDDTARQAKSSTYAKAMGVESNELGNCFWWLRSPGTHPGLFVLIRDSGSVFRGGQHANSKSRGIRPALHASLSAQKTNCTVTFESNAGSTVAPQTVPVGSALEKPEDPVREGFCFTGWYKDKDLTIAYDFSAPVTSDITLYAGWTVDVKPTPKPVDSGWQQTSNGKWQYIKDGKALTGWQNDIPGWNGIWFNFSADGYMSTGWLFDNGNWYYLASNGAMQNGWQFVGSKWYYLNQSGAMAVGWLLNGGTWYYLNSDGSMATGWIFVDAWYYLGNNGAMYQNCTTPDGYYVDGNGRLS